jgi:predicted PurR-regulated permease PerM
MTEQTTPDIRVYTQKIWIATSIVALVFLFIWFIQATFSVLLLILAGALVALYFKGLSGLFHRKLHIPPKASLLIAVIATLLLLTFFLWFAGSRVQEQVTQLTDTLPAAIERFRSEINGSTIGQKAMQHFESAGQAKKLTGTIQSFFSSTFGILGDVYVVFFLAIFFTVSPGIYIKGFLKLIPPNGRQKAATILQETGTTLTKWLKGKLFAMLVVTILTAVGLLIMGVPMALALALIAGILSFIPNFGPLIAIVPAVLIGLLEGPTTALMVGGLYILVQVLESNFITPKIQQRLIDIPPALIILAQVFMGVLSGGWALLLATPIVVIVMVILQNLYIKQAESK